MSAILVTGSGGFIGRNLVERLGRAGEHELLLHEADEPLAALEKKLLRADFVFHLAGVNRPTNPEEFESGNAGLTRQLVEMLDRLAKRVPVVFTSSIQAELDNAYGVSKRRAEEALRDHQRRGGTTILFRLPNVFGKWCRPNYNSAVATFCHNVARGLEIAINDPDRVLELVYIDDLVDEFLAVLEEPGRHDGRTPTVAPTFRLTVGELAAKIRGLHAIRSTLVLPDLSNPFVRRLYATYLSYLEKHDFAYTPMERADPRGTLVELLKSPQFGQIFVSTSHPGIVRGNHYHDTKIEKFCVVRGEAILRFRHVLEDEVLEYKVSGERIQLVDIPPGYTHSIENVGAGELVVLFWADEIFDPGRPDTHARKV